jgi:hypothetical protein
MPDEREAVLKTFDWSRIVPLFWQLVQARARRVTVTVAV